MTRRTRAHRGGIALAGLVTLATASCSDGDSTADPTEASSSADASLAGVVFDVHRDPG